MRISRLGMVGLCLVLLAAQGCSGGSKRPATSAGTAKGASTFGYGSTRDAAVAYQPDVVIVEGGPAAIRSASADGLVWSIDRKAPGMDDVQLGSVLFATSRAVGRVVELRDEGDVRTVTLAPVDITDIVKDGTIDLDQRLDTGSMVFQVVPERPGSEPKTSGGAEVTSSSTGGELRLTTPVLQLGNATRSHAVLPVAGSGKDLPVASTGSVEVPVGDWTVKPYSAANKLGIAVGYKKGAGLKVGMDVSFQLENPSFHATTVIRDGQVAESGFIMEGIKGIDVSISAGAANPKLDNSNVTVEVPIEFTQPLPPSPLSGGLPMSVKVSYTFIVKTALTGKNGTLFATGNYKLAGPFGISGGQVVEPGWTTEHGLVDSLSGISLGPSGVVFALRTELMVGVGTPAAMAGPYGSLTMSFGLTNGSAIGMNQCHTANVVVSAGGGVGLSISSAAAAVLKSLLPDKTKIDVKASITKTFVNYEVAVPDVPACHVSPDST